MKNMMINVLLFTTGAAIGSLVTWKILKDRYDHKIQEEVDSFKEEWAELMGGIGSASDEDCDYNSEPEAPEVREDEPDGYDYNQQTLFDYNSLVSKYNGSGEVAEIEKKGERDDDYEVPYINGPYVISPEDFGDGNYDHDLQSLTYYSDGVLADDWGVKLDLDETIGEDSVKQFGDYVDGVVHVRNERLQRDYEVVSDPRRYTDAEFGNTPSGYARET